MPSASGKMDDKIWISHLIHWKYSVKFLMENMRDKAIDYYDGLARGHWKGPALGKLQADLQSLNEQQRAMIRRCVISVVNVAIHDFLFKLQLQADFEYKIQVLVNGANIESLSDGLQGEPYGPNGWMARFSRHGEPPDSD
jgi:hypothetical protein